MQKRVMAKRTQLGPRSHPEYDTHGGALVEKKKEKWGKRKKKVSGNVPVNPGEALKLCLPSQLDSHALRSLAIQPVLASRR